MFTPDNLCLDDSLDYTYANVGFEAAIHIVNEKYLYNEKPTRTEIKQLIHAGICQLFLQDLDPLHYSCSNLHAKTKDALNGIPALVKKVRAIENDTDPFFEFELCDCTFAASF